MLSTYSGFQQMFARALFALVALLAADRTTALAQRCPAQCPLCPEPLPCPVPRCPVPSCPPPPAPPPCPVPRCPPLPPIPACPPPVVNVSCPQTSCPETPCPPCPACPEPSTCPPCPTLPTAAPTRAVPLGYTQVPGLGIYKFYRNKQSWNGANQTCTGDGGYMAVPNSKNEMDMLINYSRMSLENVIHVGFFKNDRGAFVSATGQPMDDFQKTLWSPGEPNSASNRCVFLNWSYSNGRMLDENCSDNESFVCEIP